MEETTPKNVEKEMAERLSGFRTLLQFRKFAYWAVVVGIILWGLRVFSEQGPRPAILTTVIGLVGGLAATRLLSAPIGAVLWYRNWRCPACNKRLGMGAVENCPDCGAQLFPKAQK